MFETKPVQWSSMHAMNRHVYNPQLESTKKQNKKQKGPETNNCKCSNVSVICYILTTKPPVLLSRRIPYLRAALEGDSGYKDLVLKNP